jgi:hypothetical protein
VTTSRALEISTIAMASNAARQSKRRLLDESCLTLSGAGEISMV